MSGGVAECSRALTAGVDTLYAGGSTEEEGDGGYFSRSGREHVQQYTNILARSCRDNVRVTITHLYMSLLY